MQIALEYQIACDNRAGLPVEDDIRHCVNLTLSQIDYNDDMAELTLRIVDDAEMQMLNKQFSGKDKPTNVLSFAYFEEDLTYNDDMQFYLGDIVISRAVVEREAAEQGKEFYAHFTHMVVHGLLHLCGFDHIETHEAEEMEAFEVKILSALNIGNPYEMPTNTITANPS